MARRGFELLLEANHLPARQAIPSIAGGGTRGSHALQETMIDS